MPSATPLMALPLDAAPVYMPSPTPPIAAFTERGDVDLVWLVIATPFVSTDAL